MFTNDFKKSDNVGSNGENFVDWSYDDLLIFGRSGAPDGFEKDLCATNSKDLSIMVKIKAREAEERGDYDRADQYWRDAEKILKAEGLDGIATAYYQDEDENRHYEKYPYEVKTEPEGKYLYRDDMDKYPECGVLEFELTTSSNTAPGWLYMLLYPEYYNTYFYHGEKEEYGDEDPKKGTTFAFPAKQIIFVLCFDKKGDRPYCTISFLFEDLEKVLDDLSGGYLSGKSGKCWRDSWRDTPKQQSMKKGTVKFGAGNLIWYVPLDALEKARPKIRMIDFDERDIEAYYGYEREGHPFPTAKKIREDEDGTTWELKSIKPERDEIAEKRMQYLFDHAEGCLLKF